MLAMGTKSREVIWGSTIMGAKIRAEGAREAAQKAGREADRAEAYAWSVQMEGYGGPAQPSPTIGQCLNGGLGWLEVECNRCKTRASLPLDAIRRPRDTPIWKLEAALKCRSCKKGRYAPPAHMIKLTATQEITPDPAELTPRFIAQFRWVPTCRQLYARILQSRAIPAPLGAKTPRPFRMGSHSLARFGGPAAECGFG
jgi:hypothetical protein